MATIAMNFLLGRTLAERVGVADDAGKNAVAVVVMGLGLTPAGVLLARQVALSRVPPPAPKPSEPADDAGTTSGPRDGGVTPISRLG